MKKCKHKNFKVSAQKESWVTFLYKNGIKTDTEETNHGFNHHTTEITCTDCDKTLDSEEWTVDMYSAFDEIGV